MTSRSIFLVSLILAAPNRTFAAPITVNLLNAAYKVTLSGTVTDNTTSPDDPVTNTATRVLSSLGPTSDSLLLSSASGSMALAEGTVDMFSTTTHTDSGSRFADRSYSWAETAATFEFAPVTDGAGGIGIDLLGRYQSQFSSGFVSLIDLTANDAMWNYAWNQFQTTDTLPWVLAQGTFTASLLVDTSFLASHTYRLEMFTSTNSNEDEQLITLGVSGLRTTVPETSSLALLLGAAVSAISGRHFRLRRTR